MSNKYSELIQRNKKPILDKILLAQFGVFIIVVILISKIEITVIRLVDIILLYWFYFMALKGYRLFQYVAILDSNLIDDHHSDLSNNENNYIEWNSYKNIGKNYQILMLSMMIFSIFSPLIFGMSINNAKTLFAIILGLYLAVYALCRLIAFKKYATNILNMFNSYREQSVINMDKFSISQFNLKQYLIILLQGLVLGLVSLLLFRYSMELSIYKYFLYCSLVTILFVMGKMLALMYRLFADVINLIDSNKSEG